MVVRLIKKSKRRDAFSSRGEIKTTGTVGVGFLVAVDVVRERVSNCVKKKGRRVLFLFGARFLTQDRLQSS